MYIYNEKFVDLQLRVLMNLGTLWNALHK